MKCLALPKTLRNGRVTSCGQYYGESCTFTCNRNHHIKNDVATSRKLTCTLTNGGTWSRAVPECIGNKNTGLTLLWRREFSERFAASILLPSDVRPDISRLD